VSVRKFFYLALAAALLMVRVAGAQSEARFQFVQPGVDPLKADLKYLVELSPTPALQKQWAQTLEPLIDSFAEGIDPAKPLRVDVVFGKEIGYELHFPIKKLEGKGGFIPNISGFGFVIKKIGDSLYSVTEAGGKGAPAKKPVFMRYANGYASIAPTQAAIPATLPNPITDKAKGVQPLLEKGFDVLGWLKNSSVASDVAARRANFQELRKQLEAGLTARRNEDKNEFALRKLSLVQNLAEAERFIVETDELLVGWTTSATTKDAPGKGKAEFSITPLAGTGLFDSTQLMAAKSSYFANVVISPKAVVAGKINFAIDPLRGEHLKGFHKAVRPVLEAQIDKRATIKDADQKKAVKEAANLLIDMLDEAIPLATADLFLDLHSAGEGKHTLICGVRAADGKKADGIMKLLPRVNAGRDVKMDIQKIGDDVSLHSVTVPERRQAAFHKLFPGESIIYVATSKDAVWGAAGVNAVEELTAAIKQAAEPAPEKVDPRVLYFSAHAARMVELLDIVRPEPQKIDETLPKDEQARQRQRAKDLDQVRKLAVDATAKCDSIFSGEIKKDGKSIVGTIDVSECVLKFIGAVTADFAKVFQ